MIVLRVLPCGLGNQLFQYAAGFALARKWGVPLKLDLAPFYSYVPKAGFAQRTYRLDRFAISAPRATHEERDYFEADGLAARVRRLVDRVRSGGESGLIGDIRDHKRLPHPVFQEPPARRPVQMTGFWEVAAYPELGGEELRRELVLRRPPDPENAALADRMRGEESVAVHVRAGDLVTNRSPAARRFVPGSDYYAAAAERIAAVVADPVFHVFSDDPSFAREVVRLPYPTEFVTHNGEERHEEDLRLMTCCRHHVLASSTFSWWGAWLATWDGQQVIAPRVFFLSAVPPVDHYYPKSWTLI